MKYLQKISDGYLYPYTETLAKRNDMRPVESNPLPPIADESVDEDEKPKLHKETLTLRRRKDG